MTKQIRIDAGEVSMTATLGDSASAEALWGILPCEAPAQTWGQEVYFKIPMHVDADDARADVPSGTIAFWPAGDCFCIFFGQTPYSPVNVLGTLDGDAQAFGAVTDGQTVRLTKA